MAVLSREFTFFLQVLQGGRRSKYSEPEPDRSINLPALRICFRFLKLEKNYRYREQLKIIWLPRDYDASMHRGRL